METDRLCNDFFIRDVLTVAPELLGQHIVIRPSRGEEYRYVISEVEAYRGTEDLACHASKGRTRRTEIMFARGGVAYVYLIYGMYWMLNVVTGEVNNPQAALIRGVEGCYGPGRVGRLLGIDKSFNGENFQSSPRLWIERSGLAPAIETGPRVGVGYAGHYWANVPWRYWIKGAF